MNWRWLREPAEKLLGRKFNYWRLTGGGALSDVWCQIMADVVGIPMHRQADPRNQQCDRHGLAGFPPPGAGAAGGHPGHDQVRPRLRAKPEEQGDL